MGPSLQEAPTPILPMGAGGPPRRAAGRVSPAPGDTIRARRPAAQDTHRRQAPAAQDTHQRQAPATMDSLAAITESDPLRRLHVVAAARELGFAPADAEADPRDARTAIAAVFVGLDAVDVCPRCGLADGRRPAASAPLVVGYAAGGRELLAAHRLHACCDLILGLRAVAGRACFMYLPAGGHVEQAQLTTREADVLVLVMGGLSTRAVAERLCLSPATARTHRRALLRKLGAADRCALRAELLKAETGAPVAAGLSAVGRLTELSSQPAARSLPRNRP